MTIHNIYQYQCIIFFKIYFNNDNENFHKNETYPVRHLYRIILNPYSNILNSII